LEQRVAGVGIFGIIVIGFLARHIPERVTESNHGLPKMGFGNSGSFANGFLARAAEIFYYGFLPICWWQQPV
jgi:hypothetical protein